MRKTKSYSSAIITLVIAAVLIAIAAGCIVMIQHLLKIGSFSEAFKTVCDRIIHPFPINPDNFGCVLLALLAVILVLVAVILLIVGIVRIGSTASYNRSVLSGSFDEEAKRHMGIRTARILSNTGIHILLIVMSIIWLIPFVCIILQSFRVESTHPVGYVVPHEWGIDNYKRLLSTNFPRWFQSSSCSPRTCGAIASSSISIQLSQ